MEADNADLSGEKNAHFKVKRRRGKQKYKYVGGVEIKAFLMKIHGSGIQKQHSP